MFRRIRERVVLPRIRGRLVDIGCGDGWLCRAYGNGIGLERWTTDNWTRFDLPDGCADTVTLVATWNYLAPSQREMVLRHAHRLLAKYGRLVVTCATPAGTALLRLWQARTPRGAFPRTVLGLVERQGFRVVYYRAFQWGFNYVYVFGKEEGGS